jgi:outer membrane protein
MKFRTSLLPALLVAVTAMPAAAQSPDAFVRVGVARLKLADEGKVAINGTVDPAADYTTPERYVASVEIGTFVADKLAVQIGGTTPGTTKNIPAGSLAGTPNLFDDTFSIFTLTGTFHPIRGGRISPYVGGGIGWQHVWSKKERLASNVEVGDAVGPVIQGGVEIDVSDRFGIYADAKKAFWKNDAAGDLGPLRITAKPELDPFILQVGGVIRF